MRPFYILASIQGSIV